jgi:hypothetical protein
MKKLINSMKQTNLIYWLIGINIIIALITVGDYGESFDEYVQIGYGEQTFNMYFNYSEIRHPINFGTRNIQYYGPFYDFIATLIYSAISFIKHSISIITFRHFFYFITFQIGILSFYTICKDFLDSKVALFTTILFYTQPLLWGHAFINPKDAPFMSIFLLSIAYAIKHKQKIITSKFYSKEIIITGILIGISSSTRILGPLSGVLIIIYLWTAFGKKSLKYVIPLMLYAFTTMVATWPFLWKGPLANYISSIKIMSSYPWIGEIFFGGSKYKVSELPWQYLPRLFSLQLTEPLIILLIFAIGIIVKEKQVPKKIKLVFPLLTIWFLPLFLFAMISNTPIYDNFRQFLFIIPPLVLLAGFSLSTILDKIKIPLLKTLIPIIVLLPGIIGLFSFHPYQYVYYNSLIDHSNISNLFESDYWLTSFRVGIEFINNNAPENAKVLIDGPLIIGSRYSRPDLEILRLTNESLESKYAFVILSTRNNHDEVFFSNAPIIFEERINGILLSVVKQLGCSHDKECN